MADASPNGALAPDNEGVATDDRPHYGDPEPDAPPPPKLPEPLILRGPVAYLMVEPMGDGRYLLTTTPGRLVIGRKEIQGIVNGLIALL